LHGSYFFFDIRHGDKVLDLERTHTVHFHGHTILIINHIGPEDTVLGNKTGDVTGNSHHFALAVCFSFLTQYDFILFLLYIYIFIYINVVYN